MTDTVPPILFHYTTVAGVHGIATSRTLRATSIRHLNDAEEYVYAHRLCWWALQQASRDKPEDIAKTLAFLQRHVDFTRLDTSLGFTEAPNLTFVTSFSEHGNQLSQWRAYCQGGGYALGFRTAALQRIASDQGYELVRCSYDGVAHKAEAEKLARSIAEKVEQTIPEAIRKQVPSGTSSPPRPALIALWPVQRDMLDEIRRVAATWKNPSFHEESEWRLVSTRRQQAKFRVGRSAIVPYTEVELDREYLKDGDRVAVLAETIIGPSVDQELATAGVMLLLAAQKIACPRYTGSAVPLRHHW